jgi:hypothetical protein
MTPLALTVVLVAAAIVCVLLGAAWLALPIFVLALVALAWAALVFARGDGRMPATHRTRDPELLGPGGPDDPDA